jgi:hypothetical protein
LLLLKARARQEQGQIAVFFIDDNFAINIKRTKLLLRDMIAATKAANPRSFLFVRFSEQNLLSC